MVPVTRLVTMLIKHVCEDRNEDSVRIGRMSMLRVRCGGILVELLQSSEDVGMSVRIRWRIRVRAMVRIR